MKFQIEFNSANVKGYRQIGYENRALADADFANDAVDGGEIGAGHMVTVLYEIVPAGSDFDVPAAEHKYGQDSNQANTSETASQDVKDKSDSAEDYTGELATVNVRYKEPDGDKSSLVSRVVKTDSYSSEMSVDMSAASAVAAYGMILKTVSMWVLQILIWLWLLLAVRWTVQPAVAILSICSGRALQTWYVRRRI